jgi:hypothetical protein
LFDAHRDGRLNGCDIEPAHYRHWLRPHLMRSSDLDASMIVSILDARFA